MFITWISFMIISREKKVPRKTGKNGEQIFRPIARFKKRPYLCTVKRKDPPPTPPVREGRGLREVGMT